MNQEVSQSLNRRNIGNTNEHQEFTSLAMEKHASLLSTSEIQVARKNEAIEQHKLRSAYEKKFHHLNPNPNPQSNPTFPLFGSSKLDP